MELNRTCRLQIAALLLAALSSVAHAQSRSSYDPLLKNKPAKPQQGFIEATLGRINPSNQDYGKCIEEGRKVLLEETLEDVRSWSNIAALGVAVFLFLVIIYQHHVQTVRQWTTADMLAQFEQALAVADAKLNQAARKNAELIEAYKTLSDASVRMPVVPAEALERKLLPAPRSRAPIAQCAIAPPTVTPVKDATDNAPAVVAQKETKTEKEDQIGLFKPDVDLMMKVNSLEQQLGRSREEAKHLRRQLNDAGRRVETEQQKNRTLKGE
jgi:hypothetical protein